MKKATIYTRNGDTGETSLIGGRRVEKDHPRVEAYGTIDELNASLGLLHSHLPSSEKALFEEIENTLLTISSILACDSDECTATIDDSKIKNLEEKIDLLEAQLPPMHCFILPAGNEGAARANLCRTICRRAERRIVTLQRECPIPPAILQYVNRLSDYLFLLQRLLCNGEEKKWEKPCR